MDDSSSSPTENNTFEVGTKPPPALLDLAASVRGLAARMVRIDSGGEVLGEVRAQIESLGERLEGIARKGADPRVLSSIEPGPEDLRPYYPSDAATWHCNPVFPPLEVEVSGHVVHGHLNLDLAYEGPPGCIHGGVVSLIFDQLLGHANGVYGTWGMTAELKVAYHRPTPLFTDLEFEAQVERVEDRKVTTRGWLACNGERTASAVGLFIRPVFDSERTSLLLGDEQVARIRAHRAEGSADDSADREAED
jgi:acyl-coenzyme A thioesterase PaaI-like protein